LPGWARLGPAMWPAIAAGCSRPHGHRPPIRSSMDSRSPPSARSCRRTCQLRRRDRGAGQPTRRLPTLVAEPADVVQLRGVVPVRGEQVERPTRYGDAEVAQALIEARRRPGRHRVGRMPVAFPEAPPYGTQQCSGWPTSHRFRWQPAPLTSFRPRRLATSPPCSPPRPRNTSGSPRCGWPPSTAGWTLSISC
jgi:hypothetical protein